jgi:hypothetical protein
MKLEIAVLVREASGVPLLLDSTMDPAVIRLAVEQCARQADSGSIGSPSSTERAMFRRRAEALRSLIPATCTMSGA